MYHQIIVTPATNDTTEWKQERCEVSLKLIQSMKMREEKYLYKPIVPNHTNPSLEIFQDAVKSHPFIFEKPPFPGPGDGVSVVFQDGVAALRDSDGNRV